MAEPGGWRLEDFAERMDMWAKREGVNVDTDLRFVVGEWLLSRMDNPYKDVKRVEGFPNFWTGVIPGSHDGLGKVVNCSYWIFEADRLVKCDNFGLLSWPV